MLLLLLLLCSASLALAQPHPRQLQHEQWVPPAPHDANGGTLERLVPPATGKQPHIMFILFDDYGWAEAGWHRNYSIGGLHVPPTEEVQTPTLDSLVASGIELDRAYAYKCCSPTRRSVSPLPCRLLSQQLIPLPPAAPSSLAATRTTSTP